MIHHFPGIQLLYFVMDQISASAEHPHRTIDICIRIHKIENRKICGCRCLENKKNTDHYKNLEKKVIEKKGRINYV